MGAHKTGSGRGWAGWVLFGGSMLIFIGAINIAEGIAALIDDKWVIVTQQRLVVVDLTGWAWALIAFGVVLCLTGAGLFSGQTWARITGIVAVSLHAIANVLWLSATPFWSILMIALDTLVIVALTAKWQTAQDQLEPYAEVREVPARDTTGRTQTTTRSPAHH